MKIIVDLECTCTDKNEFPREDMEIIEIGAILIDQDGNEISRFQTFAKPVKHPVLTDFCKSLTTITQNDVDSAPSIKMAVLKFDKWCRNLQNKHNVKHLSSWGFFDLNMLKKTASQLMLNLDIFDNFIHINESKKFQEKLNLKRKSGVGGALKILNLKFTGTQHRAIDDVINIAKIVSHKSK